VLGHVADRQVDQNAGEVEQHGVEVVVHGVEAYGRHRLGADRAAADPARNPLAPPALPALAEAGDAFCAGTSSITARPLREQASASRVAEAGP
jgi:hypothetical protein